MLVKRMNKKTVLLCSNSIWNVRALSSEFLRTKCFVDGKKFTIYSLLFYNFLFFWGGGGGYVTLRCTDC